jgi:hypothetical protein
MPGGDSLADFGRSDLKGLRLQASYAVSMGHPSPTVQAYICRISHMKIKIKNKYVAGRTILYIYLRKPSTGLPILVRLSL